VVRMDPTVRLLGRALAVDCSTSQCNPVLLRLSFWRLAGPELAKRPAGAGSVRSGASCGIVSVLVFTSVGGARSMVGMRSAQPGTPNCWRLASRAVWGNPPLATLSG
jgi:hypothetical protein